MIYTKNVTKYNGLFEKTFMEPTIHGFSVFDMDHNFIGEIMDAGFAIDKEYKHRDLVVKKLYEKGISVFDYDTFYEIELETLISE